MKVSKFSYPVKTLRYTTEVERILSKIEFVFFCIASNLEKSTFGNSPCQTFLTGSQVDWFGPKMTYFNWNFRKKIPLNWFESTYYKFTLIDQFGTFG